MERPWSLVTDFISTGHRFGWLGFTVQFLPSCFKYEDHVRALTTTKVLFIDLNVFSYEQKIQPVQFLCCGFNIALTFNPNIYI